MSLDTMQKRMSAMFIGSPWRGAPVRAEDPGFLAGNRQAAALLYSGINAATAPGLIVLCSPALVIPQAANYNLIIPTSGISHLVVPQSGTAYIKPWTC